MEIHFKGSFTKKEFAHASKLYQYPILAKPHVSLSMWFILISTGLSLMAIGFWQVISRVSDFGFVVFIIGAVIFLIGRKLDKTHEAWEAHEDFRILHSGIVTEEYFEIESESSTVRLQWSELDGYGEFKDVLMIHQGSIENMKISFPLTKRFFKNEEDWQQFRSLVVNKLSLTHQVNTKLETKINIIALVIVWLIILAILY